MGASVSLSARIRLPARARAGERIEARTLVSHVMETGYRIDTSGERVPRNIIERFRCSYDGRVIVDAELGPAIAANPYLTFSFIADRSGEIVLEWFEDTGETLLERHQLRVEPGA